ncbi:MAG: hypothetical protein JNJ46_15025 [Myxococcales bacterium]|nr:hypothetical protein [Myxococcales bacterium]
MLCIHRLGGGRSSHARKKRGHVLFTELADLSEVIDAGPKLARVSRPGRSSSHIEIAESLFRKEPSVYGLAEQLRFQGRIKHADHRIFPVFPIERAIRPI